MSSVRVCACGLSPMCPFLYASSCHFPLAGAAFSDGCGVTLRVFRPARLGEGHACSRDQNRELPLSPLHWRYAPCSRSCGYPPRQAGQVGHGDWRSVGPPGIDSCVHSFIHASVLVHSYTSFVLSRRSLLVKSSRSADLSLSTHPPFRSFIPPLLIS